MSSSSSVDKEECGLCGWGQTSKLCTSCAQKIEQANADMSSNALDSYNPSGSGSIVSSVDAVADGLGRINISNDDDDKLFQDPPPKEDCPICMLPMPYSSGLCGVYTTYLPCCGKLLCTGCSNAEDEEMIKGNIKPWCSLCRVPLPTSAKERHQRYEKQMKLNDAEAFSNLGSSYKDGAFGLPQDFNKAIELWNRGAELGSNNAHYNLAIAYYHQDIKQNGKSIYHWKLAAIGGHEIARHNLGATEEESGDMDRAMKHFMIAARSGYEKSLKEVGNGYKAGYVTKDEYANTKRAYQVCVDEMKSKKRSIVAASD